MRKMLTVIQIIFFAIFANAISLEISTCKQNPVIDGKLNDACWQMAGKTAKPFSLYKNSPSEIIPKTETMVTFGPKYLYIAFRCYHPKPEQIPRGTIFASARRTGSKYFLIRERQGRNIFISL